MAKSPFLEAAERCDRLVRAIKQKQYAATGLEAYPVEEPAALHPEEAWARRFAVHTIRAERDEKARPPLSAFVPPPPDMPRMPRFAEAPVMREPSKTAAGGHIGSALGKAGPHRGWLGRLFRGRGI